MYTASHKTAHKSCASKAQWLAENSREHLIGPQHMKNTQNYV